VNARFSLEDEEGLIAGRFAFGSLPLELPLCRIETSAIGGVYHDPPEKADMKLRDANVNSFPAVREGQKLFRAVQRIPRGSRPNVTLGNTGPEWDGKVLKPRSANFKAPYLLKGYNLEHEVPNRAGANIHLKVVAKGELTFGVTGFELPASPVPLVPAKPHVHVGRDGVVKTKRIALPLREKRTLGTSLLMVHDDGGLKRKKRQ
jgi:hypothetical protein